MKITTGKQVQPRRTMLYGVHGVGKSSWAANAPDCLMLNLEDGLNDIDCHRSHWIQDFDQFLDALRWLADSDHQFKYVAVDTVDWLERLIHKEVTRKAQKESIADIGYGAGYKQALEYWDRVTFALDWLRRERGIGIVLLSHAAIEKFTPPGEESYDRYQPDLHKLASSAIQEWCDEVLFAGYRVFTKKEDQGFNKTRAIAIGDGERFIRTQESAAVLAKNRLSMPPEIAFSWDAYAEHFQPQGKSNGNIDGTVIDGTSKTESRKSVSRERV